VLLGELREPERWLAECAGGVGRSACASSHGSDDVGRASGRQRRGVHGELPGAVGPLRSARRGDQPGERSRERRLRARSPTVQAGAGPGVVVAWQPGFCQPRGVCALRARGGAAAQRRSADEAGPGVGGVAAVAFWSTVEPGATAGACGPGEHDPGAAQRVLGAVASDRRVGGSVRGARRDRVVLRRRVGGACAAAGGSLSALRELSSRDRLAGAQARGVRRVPVPGGSVSDGAFSAGVRRAGDGAAGACQQGVRAAVAPGGDDERERRGRGPGPVAARRPGALGRGGRGHAGAEQGLGA
jgi:hypothetical protein